MGPNVMTPGKVCGCSKLQNCCPNVYDFCKSLNARKFFLVNLRTFFDIVLYCTMLKYKMGAKNHKSIVFLTLFYTAENHFYFKMEKHGPRKEEKILT